MIHLTKEYSHSSKIMTVCLNSVFVYIHVCQQGHEKNGSIAILIHQRESPQIKAISFV